jgi:polyhydroxybutyrate depolymerase
MIALGLRRSGLGVVLALAACSSSSPTPGDGGAEVVDASPAGDADLPDVAEGHDGGAGDAGDAGLVGARPYRSRVPRSYDPARPTPLIVLLHGYGASGMVQDLYFGLGRLVDERGFLYAYPDGTLDATGKRFWNATDACCDFMRTGVDDVAYITAIIDDLSARYNVDPRRVFVVGHSNGGFMANRLACDRASRLAAIVSLAGAAWADRARCPAGSPVAVLQVHGDRDDIVLYEGGVFGTARYPGAVETVAGWAQRNGCGALESTGMMLDIESAIPGAETRVARHTGCAGGAAELWTIQGGGHVPSFQATWPGMVVDWLYAHARP